MSVTSEVRRTLVKSPPELWAELSDPATLAHHLGELGEIRIVRTDPERTVDWEATGAEGAAVEVSGRVEIEPSGWGTRVTLSASRTLPRTEPECLPAEERSPDVECALEPEPVSEPRSETAIPEPERTEPEPTPVTPEEEPAPEPVSELPPGAASEPAPAPEQALESTPEQMRAEHEPPPEPEPEPRVGFFARLFRRRRRTIEPAREPATPEEPIGELLAPEVPAPAREPETQAAHGPAPEPPTVDRPTEDPSEEERPVETDISAELEALEEATTAVLTGVLDRLGAAHHRPFSRS